VTKKLSKTEKLAELNDRFAKALAFGEDEEIPIAFILQIAGHNLTEFGLWQTRGDVCSVIGILLHSFENCVMRRTNSEALEELREHIKINIDMGHEILGHEDAATTILLSSFFKSVEAMLEQYDSASQIKH